MAEAADAEMRELAEAEVADAAARSAKRSGTNCST